MGSKDNYKRDRDHPWARNAPRKPGKGPIEIKFGPYSSQKVMWYPKRGPSPPVHEPLLLPGSAMPYRRATDSKPDGEEAVVQLVCGLEPTRLFTSIASKKRPTWEYLRRYLLWTVAGLLLLTDCLQDAARLYHLNRKPT